MLGSYWFQRYIISPPLVPGRGRYMVLYIILDTVTDRPYFQQAPGQSQGLTGETWQKLLATSRHGNDRWRCAPKRTLVLAGDWVRGGE
jgi:hypothetical protein